MTEVSVEVRVGDKIRVVYENLQGSLSEARGGVVVIEDGHVYFHEDLDAGYDAESRELHVQPNGTVLIDTDTKRGYRDTRIGELRGVEVLEQDWF